MTGLYRACLRLLPPAVREEHGDQMAVVFADLAGEAARRHGLRGQLRVTAREFLALLRFAWKERSRRGHPSMTEDLRYAARFVRRSPGLAGAAISTMALAIGANIAVFSLVNGVLLKPLPFEQPHRIVVLGQRAAGASTVDRIAPGHLDDWTTGAQAFDAIAGFAPTERIITHGGAVERIRGGLGVGDVFGVLGRRAGVGRTLTAADDAPEAAPVVVLSFGLAQRLFGAAESALGETLGINASPHTIVGVMPPEFWFFDRTYEYWIPSRLDAAFRQNRDQYFLFGIARLKESVAAGDARAQLDTLTARARQADGTSAEPLAAGVVSMRDMLLGGVEVRLGVLMAAVFAVLMIACANFGNLLLIRASDRHAEVAIRHALGARPRRIVRQLVSESVLLAVAGGVLGVVLGAVLLRVLMAYLPADLPRLSDVEMNASVVLLALGVSVVAGVLVGIIPAIQLSGPAPIHAMREGTRGSRRAGWLRGSLVCAQVALALVLLTSAGLLVRSFSNLLAVPPGFDAERLLTFGASIPAARYPAPSDRSAFLERAFLALESVPGVRSASMTTALPVTGSGISAWLNIVDRPVGAGQTPPVVPYRTVRANYLEVMGISIRAGRYFTERDGLDGVRAVIVSESLARRFWPGESPVGRRIFMGSPATTAVPEAEIVGVVADVQQSGLDRDNLEAVYVPQRLVPSVSNVVFVVRTSVDPLSVIPAVRRTFSQLDPGIPLIRVQTMERLVGESIAPARSSMVLIGVFACVALLLAVIGVFGVLSYVVRQQSKELGIRVALGATSRSIKLLVIGQGLAPVAAAIIIGVIGASLTTRYLESLLFDVASTDPTTFVAASVMILAVAAAASYLPARRAALIDPVETLHQA